MKLMAGRWDERAAGNSAGAAEAAEEVEMGSTYTTPNPIPSSIIIIYIYIYIYVVMFFKKHIEAS